jgi:hypothetical protein
MANLINISDLKKWVIEKDLEKETIKGFWENFNRWREECPEEFEETFDEGYETEKLNIFINTVSLTITNWPDEDFNNVVIRLEFEYDDSYVGNYRMVFVYDSGEIFDDYFVIP